MRCSKGSGIGCVCVCASGRRVSERESGVLVCAREGFRDRIYLCVRNSCTFGADCFTPLTHHSLCVDPLLTPLNRTHSALTHYSLCVDPSLTLR